MFASILLLALLFQGGGQRQGQFPGQQQPTPTPQSTPAAGAPAGRPQPQATPTPEEPPVVTKHSIRVGGQTLNYTATTGMMPIKSREGEVEARMFFTSYASQRYTVQSTASATYTNSGRASSCNQTLHSRRRSDSQLHGNNWNDADQESGR